MLINRIFSAASFKSGYNMQGGKRNAGRTGSIPAQEKGLLEELEELREQIECGENNKKSLRKSDIFELNEGERDKTVINNTAGGRKRKLKAHNLFYSSKPDGKKRRNKKNPFVRDIYAGSDLLFSLRGKNDITMFDEEGRPVKDAKITADKQKIIHVKYNDNTEEEYYYNGRLRSFSNPETGIASAWYPDGNLFFKRDIEGQEKQYYKSGCLEFSFDKKTGEIKEWHKNGLCRFYRDAEGNETYYEPDGRVYARYNTDGTYVVFNNRTNNYKKCGEQGKLAELTSDGIKREYHLNGALKYEEKPDGSTKRFNTEEQIIDEITPEGDRCQREYKNGRLISEIKSNGTEKRWSTQDGRLYYEKLPDGSILKRNKNNIIYYEKDSKGEVTKRDGVSGAEITPKTKTVKFNELNYEEKFKNAKQSLISTIAWHLSPHTSGIMSKYAKGDKLLAQIREKEDALRSYEDALLFDEEVPQEEPEELTETERAIKGRYLDICWHKAGTREFSQGMRKASKVFGIIMQEGIEGIQDKGIKDTVMQWMDENKAKSAVLFNN